MDEHSEPEATDWSRLSLRRTPTQSRSRDKVSRAIRAAEDLVRREGVEAISLPRVAAEAGVSVGALYQYLPDRDAITRAIVARYHGRLEDLLDVVIDEMRAAPDGPDPVGRVISAVAEIYRDEELARRLGAAAPASAEATAARRAHKQRMAEKIQVLLEIVGLLDGMAAAQAASVARVAFTASDAVLHEAFAAPEPERPMMLAELQRMLRASFDAPA
ncbi:TetR/AcrR family transcriptional regulator [Microbacterium sp. 179-B 1A2 NHS]|uniref:TetR/AcrR family transcriptional regulator n=1 Tax=Microbacterium sp. 179-B 1A2 NHS TaxID=3142383 RepID=UPI0039A06819